MPEPKTIRYWTERGYSYARQGECPACHKPVEFWTVPHGNREIPLDPQTYEAHFSSCSGAQSFRMEQRLRAGSM